MSKAALITVTPDLEVNLNNVEKIVFSNHDTDGLPRQAVFHFVSGSTETISGESSKDLKRFEAKYTPDIWRVDE